MNLIDLVYVFVFVIMNIFIQFISHLLFTTFYLGEPVTRKALGGTVLILGGNVLVVMFSSTSNSAIDVCEG